MNYNFTKNLENTFNDFLSGAFLTGKDGEVVNTMTISWGSIGFMWGKPMFMALVRTTRYTNELLDLGKSFTISIPKKGELKEALKICGSVSGRDINKESEANIKFKESKKVEAPVVEGCNKYYECNIVFSSKMDLNNLDKDMVSSWYAKDKEHILYFGEIVEEY